MPYHMIRQEDQWCIAKQDTDEIVDCHDTEQDALDQLAALEINVMEEDMSMRVKAAVVDGEWALDVLSAPYGGPVRGRDNHGEYFSPNTNFYEQDGAPLPLVAYYHGYTPDGKPQGEPEIIGRAVKVWRNAQGLWHRVILDPTKALSRRVWDAAQQGKARASTGVAGFMVRVNKSGEITHWLIGELSIWDADGNRQPANQYAIARPAVKALLEQAGFIPESQDAATGDERERASHDTGQSTDHLEHEDQPMAEETTITQADVERIIAERLAAEKKQREDEAAAQQAVQNQIAAAVTAERAKWDAETAANRRLPMETVNVAKFGNLWAYDNLDAGDLSVMIGVLQSAQKKVSENALKALAIRATQEETSPRMMRTRAVMQQLGMPVKANELNQSTLASYGDEWIGVTYSTELWDKIRLGTPVVGKIPTVEIPQGSESITIPLASTSPSFYKVAQASAQDSSTLGKATYTVTSSKEGTTSQSLTVGKLGARTLYTGELEEDSLIPWVSYLRTDLENEAQEVLESLVIDGDTETGASTNVNDIAGTPASTDYFLVLDGFRKLALVTNTANSRSAGTLTVEDFLETLKLMGLAGRNAFQKDRVSFILDMWTNWKALELTEMKTRDVAANPTIENGNLTRIWGYDVITSPNMHRWNADTTYGLKANSAGKLDLDTAANNLYGAILAVRWDQWRMGWKRRMTFETQRIPQADATDIVCLMRVGLKYRDTDAAAISYGVTL